MEKDAEVHARHILQQINRIPEIYIQPGTNYIPRPWQGLSPTSEGRQTTAILVPLQCWGELHPRGRNDSLIPAPSNFSSLLPGKLQEESWVALQRISNTSNSTCSRCNDYSLVWNRPVSTARYREIRGHGDSRFRRLRSAAPNYRRFHIIL